MFREKVDYVYVDSDDKSLTGIHIIKGDYKDVLYHYNKVRIVEEGELARLQFGFTIMNPGSHDPDELTNDEGFSTMMGEILRTILQADIDDEKIRIDYTQKSIL